MSAEVRLPGRDEPLVIPEPGWAASYPPPACRRVFAAAHVAARPGAGERPGAGGRGAAGGRGDGEAGIDWEATIGFRDHLWAHGFGVAEAMDTSQRGMGLSWAQARELIARSAARAAEHRAAGSAASLACGVGTDQLADGESYRLPEIIGAYAEQLAFVQSAGAGVILMASRALAASAGTARDYLEVYGELLKQAERPVILHWLGEAFDPALRGYWGSTDLDEAAGTVVELIERAGGQVDGVKLSVLDAGREVALRRRLPAGVRLYTGDDFNYAELIRGDTTGNSDSRHSDAQPTGARHSDAQPTGALPTGALPTGARHSDALLGAFAAITAPAAAALAALDRGDVAGYDAAMGPTVPLSRLIFEPPTSRYKVGVAFLAWLNGWQPHFAMLGGLQRQRPATHLIRVAELAAAARAFTDPELAADRLTAYLATLVGPEHV